MWVGLGDIYTDGNEGGVSQNSYTTHVTSDASRVLMWCTYVTLETQQQQRHKQGDPLPPTDSLCFDSGSFFPSQMHHIMCAPLLNERKAMYSRQQLVFSDSEHVKFALNLNSTTFVLHMLQCTSDCRIAHTRSCCCSETNMAQARCHNALPFLVIASLANYQYQLPQCSHQMRIHENESSICFLATPFSFLSVHSRRNLFTRYTRFEMKICKSGLLN